MRYSVAAYEAYFQTTDPSASGKRLAMLEHEMKEGPERVRHIKAQTREVLLKAPRALREGPGEQAAHRRPRPRPCSRSCSSCATRATRCATPARSPSSFDGLVTSAEETERGVRDMEDILSAEQDLLLPGSLGDDIEAELGGLGVAREAARQAPPPVHLPNPPVAFPLPRRRPPQRSSRTREALMNDAVLRHQVVELLTGAHATCRC